MLLSLVLFSYNLFIFSGSLVGLFVVRRNLLIVLMCVEVILLSVNLNFLLFSAYLDDIIGQIFALFVLTVAASESSVGLAVLVAYYRLRGVLGLTVINLLKG